MKPVFVEGRDLDDVWFQLLQSLYDHGRRYKITSGSYAGSERVAFDFVSGFIHYPHTRPLAPRVPESSPLPPPTTDDEINSYFANYLMDPNPEENEDYRYSTFIAGGLYELPTFQVEAQTAQMWGCHPERARVLVPNQLEWCINHFKKVGFGNEHCTITIGYPESNAAYDIPFSNEQERKTSPCLRLLDIRIVDGKVVVHVVYRSWDLVSGWPTNMGGFTLLNEYIASELGIEPGPLAFSCKSLHAYDHAFDYLKQRLGK